MRKRSLLSEQPSYKAFAFKCLISQLIMWSEDI